MTAIVLMLLELLGSTSSVEYIPVGTIVSMHGCTVAYATQEKPAGVIMVCGNRILMLATNEDEAL